MTIYKYLGRQTYSLSLSSRFLTLSASTTPLALDASSKCLHRFCCSSNRLSSSCGLFGILKAPRYNTVNVVLCVYKNCDLERVVLNPYFAMTWDSPAGEAYPGEPIRLFGTLV
jgi:hypothetical protein